MCQGWSSSHCLTIQQVLPSLHQTSAACPKSYADVMRSVDAKKSTDAMRSVEAKKCVDAKNSKGARRNAYAKRRTIRIICFRIVINIVIKHSSHKKCYSNLKM